MSARFTFLDAVYQYKWSVWVSISGKSENQALEVGEGRLFERIGESVKPRFPRYAGLFERNNICP